MPRTASAKRNQRHRRFGFGPSGEADDALRDGIQRADAHADPEWVIEAEMALLICAEELDVLTSDDVWEYMDRRTTVYWPHEPSALGPIFTRAQQLGLIWHRNEWTRSRRTPNHRQIRVWYRTGFVPTWPNIK
jgi:hypothetical protein